MHYIHQDGKNVFKYAVKENGGNDRARPGEKRPDRQGCGLLHRAPGNRRIITAPPSALGMPLDKVIINIEQYGNTTAGTIPLAMQTALDEKKLKKGDLVLLAAVGAASPPAQPWSAGRINCSDWKAVVEIVVGEN